MNIWFLLALIFLAGTVGGTVNAFISDNGFFLPSMKEVSTGVKIWRPGFLGNMVIGGVAAVAFWSLYGPLSTLLLFHAQESDIPLSALGAAILVGIGGAKWLTDEVDKQILKSAATIAAEKADSSISLKIKSATPINMLEMIEEIDPETDD